MSEASRSPKPTAYPVKYEVQPQAEERNRLTVAFRLILGIPQWLLVGGPGGGGVSLGWGWPSGDLRWGLFSSFGSGVLGVAAWAMAVISWFAIVFTGKQPRGLWDFISFFMALYRFINSLTSSLYFPFSYTPE